MLGKNENEVSNFNTFFGRIHDADKENLIQNFKTAIREKKSVLTEEFRFRDQNNNYKFIYDRAYVLFDSGIHFLRSQF